MDRAWTERSMKRRLNKVSIHRHKMFCRVSYQCGRRVLQVLLNSEIMVTIAWKIKAKKYFEGIFSISEDSSQLL